MLLALCTCLCALLVEPCARAQISLYTMVDQALRNSPKVRMSTADVQRALAGLMQSKDVYLPAFMIGSGFGPPTYGFPVGEPSFLNVTATSLAFSFSQRDYIRSARQALEAAQLELKDIRQQVILDTSLDYIELVKVNQQIAALDDENGYVQKLIGIEEARVDAGRDARVDLTRARLIGAQVALKRIHLLDQADLLRARLAHLTGFTPADITAKPQTIPAVQPIQQNGNIDNAVRNSNSGIQAAYATARSKQFTAMGDSLQNNRPTFSFGMQYERFAKYNNYAEYYLRFQHNNFNAGIQVELPLFDSSRKAKAKGASADAAHADCRGRSTAEPNQRAGSGARKKCHRTRRPGAGHGTSE